MNYTAAELLKRMPKNYRELKYSLYTELMTNVISEKPDEMEDEDFKSYQVYSTISILLDIPLAVLDKLPYSTMIPLINATSFLGKELVITSCPFKVKDIETLSYKDFQSLIQLQVDESNNLNDILEIILDEAVVDIKNLSVWEVTQVMGKLKSLSMKSLRRSRICLAMTVIKMKMKSLMSRLKHLILMKRLIENSTHSTE